jgi:NifB/MoaA-like Fe-S oxidoreductase
VLSVGLVPVGVTRYQRRRLSTFESAGDARAVLDQIAPWRTRMFDERGEHWVHAADELHLLAGGDMPSAADYDDFPQFENGIGMVRAFVDELAEEVAVGPGPGRSSGRGGHGADVVLVSGEFFAPVLGGLAPSLMGFGVTGRVLCVANTLLGGNVGVAGLLAGADIARAIARDRAALPSGGVPVTYLVPDVATNDEGLFIDDLRLRGVVEQAGADVRLVSSDAAGLAAALVSLTSHTTGG